jgi:stage II sporulation protein D
MALVFYSGTAHSEIKIRVLVMDDLAKLTLHFPESYEVKDRTGQDLVVREEGWEGGSIVMDKDDASMKGIKIASKDNPININEYSLKGVIEISRNDKGLFRVINELGLEDYTKAVVGEEVSQSWPMEALKAQAVVARTYAMFKKRKAACGDYDLCSTVNSQVFNGGAKEKERPSQAARATEGEVLSFDGELVETLYHSSCGGKTEDSGEVWDWSEPYLKSQDCSCAKQSPYASWRKTISVSEIEDALKSGGHPTEGVASITVAERSKTGRAKTVRVKADTGGATLKGGDFRRIVGYSKLPSTFFDVERDGDSFVFTGKGSGHGVGLCQWGAKVMAEEGKGYREILEHYYPGTKLARASSWEGR